MNPNPYLTMYALPPIATIAKPKVDLSAISRGVLDVPEKNGMFYLSPSLITEYTSTSTAMSDKDLFEGILEECRKYADERKELVRAALKKRQREVTDTGVSLSPIDKSKLRSRREAKVHRVKEREFDGALKDVIRWFISQRSVNTNNGMGSNSNTTSAIRTDDSRH